jgi:hypothetical protein
VIPFARVFLNAEESQNEINQVNEKISMEKRTKELRSILIEVLQGLGMTKVRIMLTMAIIAAYQIEEEMVAWIATYYGKEDSLTTQEFMSRLNALTDSDS